MFRIVGDVNFSAMKKDPIWKAIQAEAKAVAKREPALAPLMDDVILSQESLEGALSERLARKLSNHHAVTSEYVREVFLQAFSENAEIGKQVRADIKAVCDRDPACRDYLTPVLYLKGFQSLVCHRIGHHLWTHGRRDLPLYLQSLMSEVFGVDIHPAAAFGSGILLDHATAFVAGETSVVGDNVSILHGVTLGGTGKTTGDRHPKIGSGVLIGAGAKVLGNIKVGDCAKIGANSVVVDPVPAHVTVAGIPARIVGKAPARPSVCIDQHLSTPPVAGEYAVFSAAVRRPRKKA